MSLLLARIPIGQPVTIKHVGGPRDVRRRLMELGLTPGIAVKIVSVSPLGDPLQLEVRGCRMSIRKKEALALEVTKEGAA